MGALGSLLPVQGMKLKAKERSASVGGQEILSLSRGRREKIHEVNGEGVGDRSGTLHDLLEASAHLGF